jgi:hypothetical protein
MNGSGSVPATTRIPRRKVESGQRAVDTSHRAAVPAGVEEGCSGNVVPPMSGQDVKQEIADVVERNRRLIHDSDAERGRRREEARRARESLRRAQQLIRRAVAVR